MVVAQKPPRAGLMAKERALAQLRALGRDGHVVRRDELVHSLFLSLRVHFGSLAAARRAAGLAPVLPRRKWSTDRVINELRALDRRGVAMRAWDRVMRAAGSSTAAIKRPASFAAEPADE